MNWAVNQLHTKKMQKRNAIDKQLCHENCKWFVHDGGIATELEFRGVHLDKDLWSALLVKTHPEQVRNVHRSYLDNGANIITTASYQFSFEEFMKRNYSEKEAEQVLLQSICLCEEARNEYLSEIDSSKKRPILIAVSLSCYGASIGCHEFDGDYIHLVSESVILEFHAKKIKSVMSLFEKENAAKPDILLFETIPVLQEALLICKILRYYFDSWSNKSLFPSVIISFSCKNDCLTCHGEHISECAQQLSRYEFVSAIGVNCTHPKYIDSLVAHIDAIISNRANSNLNMIIYPNIGDIWDAKNLQWLPSDDGIDYSKQYGKLIVNKVKAGISKRDGSISPPYKVIIGGCCRVRPCHIAQVAHEIHLLNERIKLNENLNI